VKWYWWVFTLVFVVVGIVTLVPFPIGQANLLGYDSLDPFAPISSVICWVVAGVGYSLGLRAAKKTREQTSSVKHNDGLQN
jgi:hypothetical protein